MSSAKYVFADAVVLAKSTTYHLWTTMAGSTTSSQEGSTIIGLDAGAGLAHNYAKSIVGIEFHLANYGIVVYYSIP